VQSRIRSIVHGRGCNIPGFLPTERSSVSLPESYRGINDTGQEHEKFTYWDILFDVGLKGEMKLALFQGGTETASLLAERGRTYPSARSAGWIAGSTFGYKLATAFDPFLNFTAHNTKAARQRVYALHNSGEYDCYGLSYH
jgi:hypothetical protein